MKVQIVGGEGKIKEIEYEQRVDKLTASRVEEILKQTLESYKAEITCNKQECGMENIYKIVFPRENNREVIVCIREMTPGGRSELKNEQRIQPQSQQINYIYNCRQEGKEAVLMGAYEREGQIILVAWPAEFSMANSPTTGISKQIKIDTVLNAVHNGFAQQLRGTEFVCAFRKEFLKFYINNSSWIHKQLLGHFSIVTNNRSEEQQNTELEEHLKNKYNRIIVGAPGTGKSYLLEQEKKGFNSNFERVTFHPNYSFAQFVGTYKPTPHDSNPDLITYKFVPGPFLRVWSEAYKSKQRGDNIPFLLLIEEINRANVGAVFGDVFQLLDRVNGISEYEVATNEDVRNFLHNSFKNESWYDVKDENSCRKHIERIKIPSNMYIWATMNSADQGVFPLDTAFKRRWEFEYIGVDSNEEKMKNIIVKVGETEIYWNKLRQKINKILLKECRVNEDKLLGPYFISKTFLEVDEETNRVKDNKRFLEVFKNKVIMYLYDDAAKRKEHIIFSGCDDCSTYSSICKEFDLKGATIFGDITNLLVKGVDEDDSEDRE